MWSYIYCFTTFGLSFITFSIMWWSIGHIFNLLKMERVVRFELTTSSLENSYSTNWVTHAKNGGWGKIRTFGGFHLGALAKLCIRPLCHPTVKSLTNSDFFKRRYYQSSVPLSSGVVLKWRLMSVLPGPSSFNELSFQDWCSQLISAYQPL